MKTKYRIKQMDNEFYPEYKTWFRWLPLYCGDRLFWTYSLNDARKIIEDFRRIPIITIHKVD